MIRVSSRGFLPAAVVAVVLVLIATARLPGLVAAPAAERTFFVTVHEPRGGTTALPPPAVPPDTLSKGYVWHPVGFDPARPGRWDVESYIYAPAMLVANEGERVTLQVFVVNGDKHDTTVIDPMGRPVSVRVSVPGEMTPSDVTAFDTQRGRQTAVSFRLARAGMYEVRCVTHSPSMTLYLFSLPRR
jgi:plastocyanin